MGPKTVIEARCFASDPQGPFADSQVDLDAEFFRINSSVYPTDFDFQVPSSVFDTPPFS